jgi:S-adenosylhomocysteine hydrolase
MKRIILLPIVMGAMLNLAACQMASEQVVVEQENAAECIGADCSIIRYATPNGNDLMLETENHVIQITATPGTPYTYYVWAGNKTTSDEPDIIVDQGTAMVLDVAAPANVATDEIN